MPSLTFKYEVLPFIPFKKSTHYVSAMKKNSTLRKRCGILVVLIFVIVFVSYTQLDIHHFTKGLTDVKHVNIPKYLINTSRCRIPDDNPFNEDIQQYVQRISYVDCSPPQGLLTYIQRNASDVTLHINQSLLSSYSYTKITCCYSPVFRWPENTDTRVKVYPCEEFKDSVIVTDFIIYVKCKNLLKKEVYSNVHTIIKPEELKHKKKITKDGEENPFSVIFVGIDSVSKMNLVRTMPKSHKFLESHDFFNLRGYTKIGDNTFPNLMAILSGQTWQQVYKHCDPAKYKMNDCDIIWDRFREMGYVTAYGEDQTNIHTFNYNRVGFANPPTDYYLRPYMLAAELLPALKRYGMYYCTGPENSGERIMNFAKEYITLLEDYPKFALFWMNTFSHDNLNLPSSMDDKVEQFLSDVYSYLDNTIFIFFSDHGFRFGNIRYTHTGWLEERLPFIYVHLPKSLKKFHPKEYDNFVTNTRRLTNPFDMHMTLQDVLLFANKSYVVKDSEACPKCKSLFAEVDEARTCKEAAIEQHWCMCTGHSYVNPGKKIVQDIANYIIFEINFYIKSFSDGDRCSEYFLRRIVSAGMSEMYLNEANQTVNYFLLMFETRPPAMFEATVEVSTRFNIPEYRLLGDISRVNRYADNSRCTEDSTLRKYCYCDGLFTSIKSAICSFLNCI